MVVGMVFRRIGSKIVEFEPNEIRRHPLEKLGGKMKAIRLDDQSAPCRLGS
jgi:hypothetical protein